MGLFEVKLVAVAWQRAEDVVVIVTGKAQLFEVVAAPRPVGRLAYLLHGRHEQADEDRDDGQDDQELSQGETGPRSLHGRILQAKPKVEAGVARDLNAIVCCPGRYVSFRFTITPGETQSVK